MRIEQNPLGLDLENLSRVYSGRVPLKRIDRKDFTVRREGLWVDSVVRPKEHKVSFVVLNINSPYQKSNDRITNRRNTSSQDRQNKQRYWRSGSRYGLCFIHYQGLTYLLTYIRVPTVRRVSSNIRVPSI